MALLITDRDYDEKVTSLKKQNIDIDKIENILVDTLCKKGMKIASAESCTGGMISCRITNVSGASNVFDCGVCSYSNNIKNKILGVPQEMLNTLGAVSEETAQKMCQGIKNVALSDIGISTTGIAGPSGGTEKKPVGLVYIGLAFGDNTTIYRAELCRYKQHSRNDVRHMATNLALLLAYEETERI